MEDEMQINDSYPLMVVSAVLYMYLIDRNNTQTVVTNMTKQRMF